MQCESTKFPLGQIEYKLLSFQGDSGGPLHKVMEDGRMKQIGITSFGLALGCELGLHAAFTRTSKIFLNIYELNDDILYF